MPSMLQQLKSLTTPLKAGLIAAWVISVLITAGLTWGISKLGHTPSAEPPEERASEYSATYAVPQEVPVMEVEEHPWAETVPEEIPPPKPKPKPKRKTKPRPPEPEPEPEPVEPSPASPRVLELANQVDRLLDNGNDDEAKQIAKEMLARNSSFDDLTSALESEGTGDIKARLLSLRVLQAAGYDEISRDVARVLKRSYAGTGEVAEAIRTWRILRPRVTSVESSNEGRYVIVSGTVENPDVVSARKVMVQVVALDGAGNSLGVIDTRARPRRFEPESSGTFKVSLKGLDPSMVVRTRAYVLEYEYEVLEAE